MADFYSTREAQMMNSNAVLEKEEKTRIDNERQNEDERRQQ